MHEHHPPIAVLYHSGCPDGFGAAYAAWKKFGDTAEYIPVHYSEPPPEGLAGREVYLVDFCYEEPEYLEKLQNESKRFVILDHHESTRQTTESVPEHVYDANRSGATIAWSFFHPTEKTPRLMQYLEDGDLYRYALPETREVFSYIMTLPHEFGPWDEFALALEDDAKRENILFKGRAYTEFFEALANVSINRAKKVRFEGYEVYFTAAMPDITMRSYVGKKLYTAHPPFASVATAHPKGYGISLRGDGTVDVSKIAEKYGGGGHPGSAGLFIPNTEPVPWEEIEDEDSRH